MKSSEPLSTEQMLKAVIEAQVKGGYIEWKNALRPHWKIIMRNDSSFISFERQLDDFSRRVDEEDWYSDCSAYILEILLDPDGLKAAYGEDPATSPMFFFAAHQILEGWLLGGAEEAIQTAYALLPKT